MSDELYGRTARLELADQTLREWDATVLDSSPDGVVLDRSAFYPGGGGQPPDHGVLLWGGVQTRIDGVCKGDDLVLVAADLGDVLGTIAGDDTVLLIGRDPAGGDDLARRLLAMAAQPAS